jgi:hypothetical protein
VCALIGKVVWFVSSVQQQAQQHENIGLCRPMTCELLCVGQT